MKHFFVFLLLGSLLILPLHARFQQPTNEVHLAVPYASQAPDGEWSSPWKESCEEASLLMTEHFYDQASSISTSEAKSRILQLVTWENQHLQKNDDTNAEEIQKIVEANEPFRVSIQRRPTIDDIKRQLDQQHPIIALVDMYTLYGEHEQGDSYHVIVLSSYDDKQQIFFVQDPGREGNKRVSYETLLGALHDYNASTKEADGEPTVLFTSPASKSKHEPIRSLFEHFWQKLAELL